MPYLHRDNSLLPADRLSEICRSTGLLVALITALVAIATPLAAQSLADTDDVLAGDRYLVRADDLVVGDPASLSSSSTEVQYFALDTDDMTITTADTVSATTVANLSCVSHSPTEVPFPQQTQTMRMYDLPYDVVVTLAPTIGVTGTDCADQTTDGMSFYVDEPGSTARYTTKIAEHIRNRWLHSAVGDFDGDGYDDMFIGSDELSYVATANDPEDISSGVAVVGTLNTGSGLTPMTDPAVGDFNADGNLDVAVMGTGFSSGNKPVVHFVTVCAGPVSGTVCEDAQPFQIILSSETIAPVPASSGDIVTVGGKCVQNSNNRESSSEVRAPPMAVAAGQFDPTTPGDELVVVSLYENSNNNCHVVAQSYRFTQFGSEGATGKELVATHEHDLDDIAPHSHIGEPAAIYAASGDVDWQTSSDKVAVAISSAQNHTVLVITLDDNLQMTLQDHRFSTNNNKTFAGLTFGRFSAAPTADASTSCSTDSDCPDTCSSGTCDISGFDCSADGDCTGSCTSEGVCSYIKPNNYDLQLAAFLMARSTDHPSVVYIYTADAGAPSEIQAFELKNFATPAVDRGIRAGSFLRAGDLQGRSQRLGTPTVVRIDDISQPDLILAAPPSHADWVPFKDLGTTAGFCDPDPTNCPENFSASNLCNCTSLQSNSKCDDGTDLRCLVDFSVLSGSYGSRYSFDESSTKQSSNTDTTSWSLGLSTDISEKTKSIVPPGVQLTQEVSLATSNTYDHTVSTTHNKYSKVEFDGSTVTGFWDHVWYTSRSYNLYLYPVIGQTICVDSCNQNGLCSISGGACTDDSACPSTYVSSCAEADMQQLYVQYSGASSVENNSAGAESLEWYQPVHEPGQIFSYPASCSELESRFGVNICDPNDDDFTLLSETPNFTTADETASSYSADWTVSMGSSRTASKAGQFSQTLSETVSVSNAGFEETDEGIKLKESASFNASESFSTAHTNTTELGSSTGVKVTLPGTFLSGFAYSVTGYIFGDTPKPGTLEKPTATTSDIQTTGVIRSAFTVDPRSGDWWATNSSPYMQSIDIALNRPRHLVPQPGKGASDPSVVQCLPESTEVAATEDCVSYDPADPTPGGVWNSLFYYLRGFFITPVDAIGQGPQLMVAAEGDVLGLQTRVYNYSLADMTSGEIAVDFYAQEWDTTCLTPAGYYDHDQSCNQSGGGLISCADSCDPCCIANAPVDSLYLGQDRLSPLPGFDSQLPNAGTNWTLATATFDTGDPGLCGSDGCGGKSYVFWVVVWPELTDNGGSPALGGEVPDHSLTSIPGTLSSISDLCPKSNRCSADGTCLATGDSCTADTDCPGPADNICGSGGTCTLSGTACTVDSDCGDCLCAVCIEDFSNNVGLYRQAFYVEPAAAEATSSPASAATSGVLQGDLSLDRVSVAPSSVRPGDKAVVRAGLRAVGDRIDGQSITFHAVPPDRTDLTVEEVFDQIIPFDVEVLAHIPAERVHEAHAPFFPQQAGNYRIFVSGRVDGERRLLGTTDLEVTGPTATPTNPPATPTPQGSGDDDGCAVAAPSPGPRNGVLVFLLPILLVMLRSAASRGQRPPDRRKGRR